MARKAHTVTKRLSLVQLTLLNECLPNEKSVKEIVVQTLYNDTVTHLIKYLAANMKSDLLFHPQNYTSALQMAESKCG